QGADLDAGPTVDHVHELVEDQSVPAMLPLGSLPGRCEPPARVERLQISIHRLDLAMPYDVVQVDAPLQADACPDHDDMSPEAGADSGSACPVPRTLRCRFPEIDAVSEPVVQVTARTERLTSQDCSRCPSTGRMVANDRANS